MSSMMMGGVGAGAIQRRIRQTPPPSQWPQVEGYELRGVLGVGSFAEVYLAHELTEDGGVARTCALKIGELHDRKRFAREVRGTAVSHPNLIDYFGSGVIEDTPNNRPLFWISMPNLSGMTLADLMRQELDEEQRLLLSMQVLEGLSALHSTGLSHRDLKPENALIGDEFEVQLSDFGLSKGENSEEEEGSFLPFFWDDKVDNLR